MAAKSWPAMTDYQEAIQNPLLCFTASELRQCKPETDRLGLPRAISGNFAVVFPMNCNGQKWAVRCFSTYHPDQEQRYAVISRYLQQHPLPYMVGFVFQRQGIRIKGQLYPLLKMEWVAGEPLNAYIEKNLRNRDVMQSLANRFLALISDLKRHSIAHGDLQHGNILMENGNIRLIDYDGMYVPGLEGMRSHEVGHRNYQHPSRTQQDFGPCLDHFSAWVIYMSLLALSIDPDLWHRFQAGDEHLLFRREDFESPEASEALQALEQIRDDTVRSFASSLRALSYHPDLPSIPPLDEAQVAVVVQKIDLPDTGASWVWDHIQVSPARISISCIPERFSLATFVMISIVLGYGAMAGLLVSIVAASAFGVGLTLILLVFTFRFRFSPEVSEKYQLLSSQKNLQREVKQVNSVIRYLNDKKKKLYEQEEKKVREITSTQREVAQKERTELEKVDDDLKRFLSNIDRERQPMNRAETNALAQALRDFQTEFLANQLVRYDLASADIRGIGWNLKNRLAAAGIRTAADIVDIHIDQTGWGRYLNEIVYIEVPGRRRVHVEGIGPKKASALLAWRRSLESTFKARMPQSLPRAQEVAIRVKYEAQRQSLDLQEANANKESLQKKSAIATKYRQDKQVVAKQLQAVRDQYGKIRRDLDQEMSKQQMHLPDKHWAMAKVRRELDAYRQVNFAAYLKRILFLRM